MCKAMRNTDLGEWSQVHKIEHLVNRRLDNRGSTVLYLWINVKDTLVLANICSV